MDDFLILILRQISARERIDSELLYLSFVSKNVPGNDEEKCRFHPQWATLCQSA